MRYLISILLVLAHLTTCSQDSVIYKKVAFLAKVRTIDNQLYSGFLWALNDTALQITNYRDHPSTSLYPGKSYIHYSNIESLQLRRRDATTRGLLKGATYGAFAGIIVGMLGVSSEVDSESSLDLDRAVTVGRSVVIGAAAGAAIGTIVGAVSRTTISIKGRKERMREAMQKISARKKQQSY